MIDTTQAEVDLSEFRKTGDYDHYIGVFTPGFQSLSHYDQMAVIRAFQKAPRGDHHYTVTIGDIKVYIGENGERGYTAMLPGEY